MGKCPKIELHSRVHQTAPACILQSHGCTSHILGPYIGGLASRWGGGRSQMHIIQFWLHPSMFGDNHLSSRARVPCCL